MGFRKRGLILALGIALTGCGQNDPGLAKTMDITKAQRAAIEDRIKSFSVVNVIGGTAVAAVAALPGDAKDAACGACQYDVGPSGRAL